jgi:hypothetical protein
MIIDTHQHLGRSLFTGVVTTSGDLLAAMDECGIDQALVMPQPTREDIRQYHDEIARACAESSGRLVGMASIDPWLETRAYQEEARRCLEGHGFVALKLHPLAHNIASNHPEAEKVFRTADELGVPVIVHTGLGCPWALPSLCIPPARKYRRVPVILAHAGWGVYSAEAVVAAEVCENIVLEPSWCPTYVVHKLVSAFGAERVLFGSDHVTNMPVELAKYRAIGLSESQRTAIFADNPRRVFRLVPQQVAATQSARLSR